MNRYIPFILTFVLMALVAHSQTHHVDVNVDELSSGGFIVDGIDVSDHQKVIDWDALATDKRIKYVYIKATEGASFTSPSYRRNVEGARRVGIKVGSYHFMRTGTSIRAQFENFTRSVKKSEQDLIPLLDVETRKGWSNQQLRDSVKYFCDLLEEYYGVKPMIYTNAYYYDNLLGGAFKDYPLFIARYASNAPVLSNAKWILWQFSEKGRLPGINHAVDLSRFNKGCSLRDIAMKSNKIGTRKRTASEAVNRRDKPGSVNVNRHREQPAMSKQQEKELKKQQEKERKARERAEKMAADEAKKRAEAQKKEDEKRRKQQEAEKKRKQQEAHEKARLEQDRKKKQQEQQEAEKRRKQQEAHEKAEAEAKAKQQKQEREARLKQQQQQQQQAKQEQKQKLQQQKQNVRSKTTTDVRKSTRSRTNKSSADND